MSKPSAPVRLRPRTASALELDALNERNGWTGAEQLELAARAIGRIKEMKQPRIARLRSWLRHPDDRVPLALLRRLRDEPTGRRAGGMLSPDTRLAIGMKFQEWAREALESGELWNPLLDQACRTASSLDMLRMDGAWMLGEAPSLQRWVGLETSTVERARQMDVQVPDPDDEVTPGRLLRQLANWMLKTPGSGEVLMEAFDSRLMTLFVARYGRGMEARTIKRLESGPVTAMLLTHNPHVSDVEVAGLESRIASALTRLPEAIKAIHMGDAGGTHRTLPRVGIRPLTHREGERVDGVEWEYTVLTGLRSGEGNSWEDPALPIFLAGLLTRLLDELGDTPREATIRALVDVLETGTARWMAQSPEAQDLLAKGHMAWHSPWTVVGQGRDVWPDATLAEVVAGRMASSILRGLDAPTNRVLLDTTRRAPRYMDRWSRAIALSASTATGEDLESWLESLEAGDAEARQAAWVCCHCSLIRPEHAKRIMNLLGRGNSTPKGSWYRLQEISSWAEEVLLRSVDRPLRETVSALLLKHVGDEIAKNAKRISDSGKGDHRGYHQIVQDTMRVAEAGHLDPLDELAALLRAEGTGDAAAVILGACLSRGLEVTPDIALDMMNQTRKLWVREAIAETPALAIDEEVRGRLMSSRHPDTMRAMLEHADRDEFGMLVREIAVRDAGMALEIAEDIARNGDERVARAEIEALTVAVMANAPDRDTRESFLALLPSLLDVAVE